MKLSEYIDQNQTSIREISKKLDVSYEAVRRYAHEGRVPDSLRMKKLMKITKGQVTANDFYQ